MSARKDPFGEFSQSYLFEIFENEPSFTYRKMFGGLAIYLFDRMVCVLTEDPTGTKWQDKDFGFPIWNGLLIPTEYEHHESLQREFAGFQNHPVLKKWMYLALTSPHYEDCARGFIKRLRKQDPRLGVVPGKRARKRRVTRIKIEESASKSEQRPVRTRSTAAGAGSQARPARRGKR